MATMRNVMAALAALCMTWGAVAQPTGICFSEKYPGTVSGNPSYFDVTTDTAVYDGWCLDGTKHIDTSGTYTGDIIDLATAKIPNIDMVLWVLNQHYPGKTSTGGTTFVFDDVQAAIWQLIGSAPGGGIPNADVGRVAEIVAAAQANGKGFAPTCGQISAEVLQPTAIGCPNGTPEVIQPILIEIAADCPKLACIGDFVWNDLNKNGIQEAGEPGIAGVTVELIDCATGAVVATTTTDANGNYLFSNLVPGSYRIHVVAPAGYVFSPANVGTDDAVDSDSDQTGLMPCTDLAAGECDLTWDAGLYLPPPPPENPGTGTPGYWMNHPNAWPVDSITIGCITYSKKEAIAQMKLPVKQDKRLIMIPQLISAELNVLIGNDDSCIADVIAAADKWLCDNKSKAVSGGSAAWAIGAPLASELDDYNNGRLCAPHRDSISTPSSKAAPLRPIRD